MLSVLLDRYCCFCWDPAELRSPKQFDIKLLNWSHPPPGVIFQQAEKEGTFIAVYKLGRGGVLGQAITEKTLKILYKSWTGEPFLDRDGIITFWCILLGLRTSVHCRKSPDVQTRNVSKLFIEYFDDPLVPVSLSDQDGECGQVWGPCRRVSPAVSCVPCHCELLSNEYIYLN